VGVCVGVAEEGMEVAVAVDVGVAEGETRVGVGDPGVGEGATEVGVGDGEAKLPWLYVTRTATQSRKKSRDVELATFMTRMRKFASVKFAALHVRPQVSVGLPRINVLMLVLRVAVDFAAVQVAPPSQESCTHILGALAVLSARASRRTSMPAMVAPLGMEKP